MGACSVAKQIILCTNPTVGEISLPSDDEKFSPEALECHAVMEIASLSKDFLDFLIRDLQVNG